MSPIFQLQLRKFVSYLQASHLWESLCFAYWRQWRAVFSLMESISARLVWPTWDRSYRSSLKIRFSLSVQSGEEAGILPTLAKCLYNATPNRRFVSHSSISLVFALLCNATTGNHDEKPISKNSSLECVLFNRLTKCHQCLQYKSKFRNDSGFSSRDSLGLCVMFRT